MEIYENGTIREATQEEIERAARDKEAAEKVIVQLSLAEVLRLMNKEFFETVPDDTALQMVGYFKEWVPDIDVAQGDRMTDEGVLYRCVQAHHTQQGWEPHLTPALWVVVSLDEWPEWVQPTGAQDAYNKGDKVSHNSKHWTSDVDTNVWEPGVYGWTEN